MTTFLVKNTASGALSEIEATAPFDAGVHLPPGTYRIAAASGYAAQDLVIPDAADPGEAGAAGHWLLGSDNPGHAGLTGAPLTIVNTAPALRDGHVAMASGDFNGLETGFTETADVTMAGVVRLPSAGAQILFGRFNGAADPRQAVFQANGSFRHNAIVGGAQVLDSGIGGGGVWTFVAVSMSAAGARVVYVRKGGGSTVLTDSITRAAATAGPVAIGAVGTDVLINDGFDAAEVIVWDSALSEADLDDVYARSAARLAGRGITLGA